jgi:subtilisin family serine protease
VSYVAFSLWILILSAADIFVNWAVEQTLVEDSTTIPDIRWIVHGIIALILLISLIIAYFAVKTPRLKLSVKVWMMAAILAVLAIPAKRLFITQQQPVAAYEILIIGLMSLVILFFQKKKELPVETKRTHSTMIGLVVLLCAGLSIPWLLWGSLGSIDDTLLYIVLGACFAVFTVLVIFPNLLEQTQDPKRELAKFDFLLDGLAIALFYLICVTGLAQNGSQLMLSIVLPIGGWVIAGLGVMSRRSIDRAKIGIGFVTGFLIALPLLWFDADELSLLITGTPGETFEWANRAAWTTMGIRVIVIVLCIMYFKVLDRIIFSKQFNLTVSMIAVAAVCTVYLLWGRPGFFGDQLFVVMKNQADLTQVNQIQDLSQRRQAVYDTLVKTANESQSSIRKQLDQWHVSYTPYYLINGLEVNAGAYQTLLLQKRSDIDRILQSPQLRPLPRKAPLTNSQAVDQPNEPTWNLKMIEVDKVRQDLGITGKGIIIGQTDTGVDGYHPEVKSSYRGANGVDDYNWLDPWYHTIYPADAEGHGTATLALITGKNIGIAPDAQWIGCVNLGRDLGNPAVYLNCMQFMLAPYPQNGNSFTDGVPAKGAMIVNNSWGCPAIEGCDAKTFQSATQEMETAGIFMSVAAGNTGDFGCSTITDPPAIYDDVMTVGSINQAGNISDFSSLGPVAVDGSDRIKPDLLAPGEGIVSAFPNNAYTQADGTSFSAPHLSGVVALMWSANPKLIGNVLLTKKILDQTAKPYSGKFPICVTDKSIPNDASGYGILNAYAAVEAALAVK